MCCGLDLCKLVQIQLVASNIITQSIALMYFTGERDQPILWKNFFLIYN